MYQLTTIDKAKADAKVLIVDTSKTTRTIRCQHGYTPPCFVKQYSETVFVVNDADYNRIAKQVGMNAIQCDF